MLSRRAGFSLFVAAGLAVTFTIKQLAPNSAAVLDESSYNDKLAGLLTQQGFAVKTERRGVSTDIIAIRGKCRLRARMQGALFGYAAFRNAARDFPVPAYRYRGRWLRDFPRGTYEVFSRLQWLGLRFGLVEGVEMPLLAAVSEGCDRAMIDFGPQQLTAKRR